MKEVVIKFKVREEVYDQYEGVLQEFLNYLADLRTEDVNIWEFD